MAFDEGTLPPPLLMYLVAGTADANWFIDSGRLAVESIEEALRRQGTSLDNFSSVLDFGSGAGRVIRHLSSHSNLALAGCDYNPQLVEWCRRHLSFANFQVNPPSPNLPYTDAQFDLIYAFSVFTHLTVDRQRGWLDELARVLRPGGMLVVSVSGDAYLHKLNSEQRRRYSAGEIMVILPRKQGQNECAAYHPPKAFRSLVAGVFDVLDFMPEGAKGNPVQDLWVCRKPICSILN